MVYEQTESLMSDHILDDSVLDVPPIVYLFALWYLITWEWSSFLWWSLIWLLWALTKATMSDQSVFWAITWAKARYLGLHPIYNNAVYNVIGCCSVPDGKNWFPVSSHKPLMSTHNLSSTCYPVQKFQKTYYIHNKMFILTLLYTSQSHTFVVL